MKAFTVENVTDDLALPNDHLVKILCQLVKYTWHYMLKFINQYIRHLSMQPTKRSLRINI